MRVLPKHSRADTPYDRRMAHRPRFVSAACVVVLATTALAAPSVDPAFLPIETRCQSDADCDRTTLVLEKETNECCELCKPTAGTKAWVARVQSICAAKIRSGFRPSCGLGADCGEPPKAVCRAGACTNP